MKTRDFWSPTKAAADKMAELNIRPERRAAPNATMFHGGTELPEEFVVVSRGTPGEQTRIGLSTEPVGMVIAAAERIAAERLATRPGCGSPDGQIAHDEDIAIAAMRACGHSRHVYKGEVMPWWHHEMFGPARYAAMRVASGAA